MLTNRPKAEDSFDNTKKLTSLRWAAACGNVVLLKLPEIDTREYNLPAPRFLQNCLFDDFQGRVFLGRR